MKNLKRLWCLIVGHAFTLRKHIKGDHGYQTWVACFDCQRCLRRFIMSEVHQAFLRYDNDPTFKADIPRIYPHVRLEEL